MLEQQIHLPCTSQAPDRARAAVARAPQRLPKRVQALLTLLAGEAVACVAFHRHANPRDLVEVRLRVTDRAARLAVSVVGVEQAPACDRAPYGVHLLPRLSTAWGGDARGLWFELGLGEPAGVPAAGTAWAQAQEVAAA
jgi:hypothetical protein